MSGTLVSKALSWGQKQNGWAKKNTIGATAEATLVREVGDMPEDVEPTVQDMIDKLGREMGRLRAAKQLEDAIDHATNGAVTAWQVADWIWSLRLKNSPETRSCLGLEGCKHIKELERDFKKMVVADLPELQLCADIAGIIKHVTARTKSRPPHPRASGLPGARDEQRVLDFGGPPEAPVFTSTTLRYVAYVRDDAGNEHDMDDVLGACRNFWVELTGQLSP